MITLLRSSWTSERAALLLQLSLTGAVLLSLFAAFYPRFPGDHQLSTWVQAPATPWLEEFMRAISTLGRLPVALVSIASVGAALTLTGRWREGLLVWMVSIPEALLQVLKTIIDRPRPPDDLVRVLEQASTGSFPSGHAYHGLLLLGLLIFLSSGIRNPWLRNGAVLSLTTLLLLVGLSRVYLGAHWPSDVLGSALFAIPTLLVFLSVYQRVGGCPPGHRELRDDNQLRDSAAKE